MTNPQLDQALEALPHGKQFRFLDRLLSLVPGKHGTGEYLVRGDESFLQGHFPGDPLMPGVLLIEAAAQLAGTIAQSDLNATPIPGLKLTAVHGAKILGSARPGETIHLESQVMGRLGNLVQARATVTVADRVICRLELVLSGAEAPKPEPSALPPERSFPQA